MGIAGESLSSWRMAYIAQASNAWFSLNKPFSLAQLSLWVLPVLLVKQICGKIPLDQKHAQTLLVYPWPSFVSATPPLFLSFSPTTLHLVTCLLALSYIYRLSLYNHNLHQPI